MANEFLNKARDAAGSVIYTASTEDTDGKPVTRVQFKDPQPVQLSGSKVAETKTQANASGGVVTFAKNISYISILNKSDVDGVFNVNSIDIHVPAKTSFSDPIGGTPRATVNITGATSYAIMRYE